MYLRVMAAAAAAMTLAFSATAQAKPWVYWEESSNSRSNDDDDEARPSRRRSQATRVSHRQSSDDGDGIGRHSGLGPRPGAWCGWYMRSRHGGGPEFNLAANWRRWGNPGSPQIGAIVVWPHHVGEIVGQAANGQWIILSGNDGGAVRRRARSIAGATIRV